MFKLNHLMYDNAIGLSLFITPFFKEKSEVRAVQKVADEL